MFDNGSISEYTITEGFTRNLYLLFDGVPTQYSSRLDYDWYSSNNSVAEVTAYGTVLGLNVEEDTEVTIYAIRKSDPSIIYKRTFTILNDFNEEIRNALSNGISLFSWDMGLGLDVIGQYSYYILVNIVSN